MKEIQHTYGRKINRVKTNPTIDYSALVSLSFMLMLFFMLVKSLERPNFIKLPFPDDCCDCGITDIYDCNAEIKKVTLLLAENNKIIYYRGNSTIPIEKPVILNYSKESIRKELTYHKKRIQQIYNESENSNRLRVIIKPTSKCSYGNLIDVLDEMNIVKPRSYVIEDDFSKEEIKMIAMK